MVRSNRTEVEIKAKLTNWLITVLIGVVSWVGKNQYEALKDIGKDLQAVAIVVQVHDTQIKALQADYRDLKGLQQEVSFLDKPFFKHEEFFEFPKRKILSKKFL